MRKSAWNHDEQRALQGLSLLAQVIYLRAFRWRMDYTTGVTGGRGNTIKRPSLTEIAEFVPDHGSTRKKWRAGREEIRAAISELQRAGLIINNGSTRERGYVFHCPLANTDESFQNVNPQGTPNEPPSMNPTGESSNGADSRGGNPQGTPKELPSMNPHPSGIRYTDNSVERESSNLLRPRVDHQRGIRTPIPDDFAVTEQHVQFAGMHRLPNPHGSILKFIAHHQSKGTESANWDAAFHKWLITERGYEQARKAQDETYRTTGSQRRTASDRAEDFHDHLKELYAEAMDAEVVQQDAGEVWPQVDAELPDEGDPDAGPGGMGGGFDGFH